MTTVLLWGDRWWLPHHKIPVPFASPDEAAAMLAAAWPPRLKAIRLLYQPDDLVTVPADCPNGNRATLAMALGAEHPALVHPGHVWSHEPILARHGMFQTLLHYETHPGLFHLVQRLEEHGFTVASVWPLATWLNAIPPDLSPTGSMTIIAFSADRFCRYRHTQEGERSVLHGHGPHVIPEIAAQVKASAQNPDEFVMYVASDDSLLDALGDEATLADGQVGGMTTLSTALAKPVVLPPKHPAQLLPPLPKISRRRLVQAATGATLLLALTVAGLATRDFVQARRRFSDQTAQLPALRMEVAELRRQVATAAEASKGENPGLPAATLLMTLTRHLPRQVVLTSIQADREGFQVSGGVSDKTLSEADWRQWQSALQESAGHWQLAEPVSRMPTGDFTMRGLWL
jgi:hypothetical protein